MAVMVIGVMAIVMLGLPAMIFMLLMRLFGIVVCPAIVSIMLVHNLLQSFIV